MRDTTSLMLVGVGGQGTVLVTSILSKGLVAAGHDVKMAEVHGMAQRGGSVSTQVRYGDVVHSPIVGKGGADVLAAFETMEALRWLEFVKPGGKVVVNDCRIPSAPILTGQQTYPEGIIEILKSKVDTTAIRAADVAEQIGDPRVVNLVLFGALVEAIGLTYIDWEPVIASTVKKSFVDLNLAAYRAGRRVVAHPEKELSR
ncbi:MAG: indolepyruvate oxidoreductase subunit beta [Alphaproteobacteria bacterium]|nr:indolepyruvate oxidoreductase subunit beta [Alphaproteobacteria bacterium]MDE2111862.1 indolepyruvate oxidoreductase subunit beta [Alphaproteobacteria bacterium]MDE2493602.1 indolepyruvate oxidoreductase subunit beta [Alphaproteobacteria bacterium]